MTTDTTDIPQNSDKDALARDLEMDIIFGRLYPNQRLIEDELMARFGQSRHRVRRAIDTLVLGGLAVREVNKGAHVCSYSGDEVRDLYELRCILEAAALGRTQLPIDQATIDALREFQSRLIRAVEAQDLAEVFHLNNDFHARIFACCGNSALAGTIDAQARRSQPIRSMNFNSPDYLHQALAEHEQMIDALVAGDLQTLVKLNEKHILRPMEAYLAQYGLNRRI